MNLIKNWVIILIASHLVAAIYIIVSMLPLNNLGILLAILAIAMVTLATAIITGGKNEKRNAGN